jgi:hypothetical protein
LLSATLQLLTYQKFGGVMSYINAATSTSPSTDADSSQFQGMGMIFIVSESFPILAMMGFAVYAQKYKRLRTLPVLIGVLMIFFSVANVFWWSPWQSF